MIVVGVGSAFKALGSLFSKGIHEPTSDVNSERSSTSGKGASISNSDTQGML